MTEPLKQRLIHGEKLLGMLVRTPAEELTEMAGVAGMDFIFIDAEHGPSDVLALRTHITIAQLYGMAVLVRVGIGDASLIARALDHGADGIVIPHVDDAATAQWCVTAARYPPLGNRGFATYGRAGRYGTVSAVDHRANEDRKTLVIPMIESSVGVTNVAAIAEVAGVDALMVGPVDLAVATDSPSPDQLSEYVDAVHHAAATAGRSRLQIVGSAPAAASAFADGANLVVINTSHAIMQLFNDFRAITTLSKE